MNAPASRFEASDNATYHSIITNQSSDRCAQPCRLSRRGRGHHAELNASGFQWLKFIAHAHFSIPRGRNHCFDARILIKVDEVGEYLKQRNNQMKGQPSHSALYPVNNLVTLNQAPREDL